MPRERQPRSHAQPLLKRVDQALADLAEALRAERPEALMTYLAALGRFPNYSWENVLLIQAQRPDATYVARYQNWHQWGRWVKPGEKGIAVLATAGATSRPAAGAAGRFRTAHVFDVTQTEGWASLALAKATRDPKWLQTRLLTYVAELGMTWGHATPTRQRQAKDDIEFVPWLRAEDEFFVIARELGRHLLGAEPGPSLDLHLRDHVARACALVTCRGAGVETSLSTFEPIELPHDVKMLRKSLAAIQQTASHLLDRLFPEPLPEPPRTSPPLGYGPDGSERGRRPSQSSASERTPLTRPERDDSVVLDR